MFVCVYKVFFLGLPARNENKNGSEEQTKSNAHCHINDSGKCIVKIPQRERNLSQSTCRNGLLGTNSSSYSNYLTLL